MKSYYPVYDYPVNQTGAEENWKIKKVYFVNQGMVHYDAIHFWEIIIIINTSYYYHFSEVQRIRLEIRSLWSDADNRKWIVQDFQ